jgi:hypothetical protein
MEAKPELATGRKLCLAPVGNALNSQRGEKALRVRLNRPGYQSC